jgi:drug/metabolite transporter (DMT)-like permease
VPPLPVLHLVVLAWAFTAILGKLISLPALDMVVWRTGMATGGFVVLAFLLRSPLRPGRRDSWILFGIGALLGAHWVLFFLSGRLATASVSLAAMPTMLIWCSLLEPLLNGSRRWSRVELIVGLVIVGAVWMIYAVELEHWAGFTVGILSAAVASVYAVLNKQVVANHPFATLCAWQLAGACAASWGLLPVFGGAWLPAMPDARDFAWLVLFAFGCTVLPYAAFVYVMRRLPVFTVNVVYNLEPLYGMALAALVFGDKERMTPGFYFGAGLIVASVLAVPWLQRKAAP